ncbi:MAG: LON peptidase substrate-binding domain-containing protein [Anaerolineae bacterium]
MTAVRVSIWPTHEIIFPGQLTLLPETEPWMRTVVRLCRGERAPAALIQISEQMEHRLSRVGTLVNFLDFEESSYPAGPHLAVGHTRFKVLSVHYDRPYPEATVQVQPWAETPRPPRELVVRVGDYLWRYALALQDLMPSALLPKLMKPSPTALAVLGAGALKLPPSERQRLLELESTQALLQAVLDHLRVQVPIAEQLASVPPSASESPLGLFFN